MADTGNSTQRMPRGAIPSPRWALAAANPHVPDPSISLPQSYLAWPTKLSYWGNNKHDDCVSAEEAFAKITALPYIYISESTLIGWASQHGYLEGASIYGVLKTMHDEGLAITGGTVFDGPFRTVNWTDASTLQSAIFSHGPVKIGIGADDLQDHTHGHVKSGKNGWALYGYPSGLEEDHCVSLCGYGNLADLEKLFKDQGVKVSVPKGMPTGMCYAMFTWKSIGIIDEQSMLNMTYEAWVRNPVTILSELPTVSKLKLKNDGGFVVDIHALYRGPGIPHYSDKANHHNFPIAQTRTMNLSEKCEDPAIQTGDIVQMKVWVEAGHDNTYSGLFRYDPKGPAQSFKISGSTLNNSLEYLGPA